MRSILRLTNLLQSFSFFLLVMLLAVGLYSGAENLGYNWQWFRISRYLLIVGDDGVVIGPLLQGLFITLQITVWSLVLSFFIGLITSLLRLSNSPMGLLLANTYLELIRNTPLLVQIFVVYFVLAPIFDVGRFAAAVLALSLFEGAYASEIIRAGILSVQRGQWEAARALGLNSASCYRHIILPQAVRKMIPPLTSQSISLVKDSALVSTIAIYDLTMQGQRIIAETYMVFELWFTIAIIYLFMTAALSVGINIMEKRLTIEM